MTDKPAEALERAEELLVSQARLSFDPSRVAIRRDDLRVLVRLANAMHQASDTGDDDRDALIGKIADLLNIRRAIAHLRAGYPLDEDQRTDVIRWLDRLQAKAHEGDRNG
jgi:hypothetical protein